MAANSSSLSKIYKEDILFLFSNPLPQLPSNNLDNFFLYCIRVSLLIFDIFLADILGLLFKLFIISLNCSSKVEFLFLLFGECEEEFSSLLSSFGFSPAYSSSLESGSSVIFSLTNAGVFV